MKLTFKFIFILLFICIILSGCAVSDGSDEVETYPTVNEVETYPTANEDIIIEKIQVSEQPLSEINTYESDDYAALYGGVEPYFDDKGGMYYYKASEQGDSIAYFLYYDNGVDEAVNIGLPEIDLFTVGMIIDDVIYGVEHNHGDANECFIAKFQNSEVKRLFNFPVMGCYFAQEGIYYQSGNKIYLTDYNVKNYKLIVEIPVELYVDSHSKFIVYRGKLWYSYADPFKEYYFPLWCYDFDRTFTKFDKGGLDTVNNGFLYYKVMDSNYKDKLYRFNCDTYCVEPVVSDSNVMSYCFADNCVIYSSWDSAANEDGLYKLTGNTAQKILSSNQLGALDGFTTTLSCTGGRIFIEGSSGLELTCLAEIDIDGNILNFIHED